MDTASLSGRMGAFIVASGKMVNSMEKGYTYRQMVWQGTVFGSMVKGRSGYSETRRQSSAHFLSKQTQSLAVDLRHQQ
jgi:hypothetical protein